MTHAREDRSSISISHTFSQRQTIMVLAALLFLPSCASAWDGVSLDTGLGVGLPMIGVSIDTHCKLQLGKFQQEVSRATTPDPDVAAGRVALLELRDWPVRDP